MEQPSDTVRIRVFVDGELVEEDWLNDDNSEELGLKHFALTEGQDRWLVEVFNPHVPEEGAYVRFGTDDSMMTEPIEIPKGESVDDAIARLTPWWAEEEA